MLFGGYRPLNIKGAQISVGGSERELNWAKSFGVKQGRSFPQIVSGEIYMFPILTATTLAAVAMGVALPYTPIGPWFGSCRHRCR